MKRKAKKAKKFIKKLGSEVKELAGLGIEYVLENRKVIRNKVLSWTQNS